MVQVNELENEINKIRKNFEERIKTARNLEDIKKINIDFFGDNSFISKIFKSLPTFSHEEKKTIGKQVHLLSKEFEESVSKKQYEINCQVEEFDLSLPLLERTGYLHPISISKNLLETIFLSEGFERFDSPEIETEFNNFTALNIDEKHPTRDNHQSFFLENEKMLRTHTTSGYARMLSEKHPTGDCKVYFVGRTYRKDDDRTHSPMFHQVDVIVINENANLKELVKFIRHFLFRFFNRSIEIRIRPNHFPFTHLSIEVDMLWNNKWLEVMGAGIIHENVFKNIGQEPRLGFALGCGVERLHMIKYGVTDLRDFYNNDIRNVYKNGRRSYETNS